MANPILNEERFHDEDAAFAYIEGLLWPNGPVCRHCGNANPARIRKMAGKTTRKGLYNCRDCRKQFTVRMGTLFESSHLPLHIWLQVIHLMCASKKGISTRQIQRMLQCSMKTAWHLTHRIREAMRAGELSPMGGPGKIVEVDETIQGKMDGVPREIIKGGRSGFRNVALTLVERGGSARSFHVEGATMANLLPVIRANIHHESTIMTDELSSYLKLGEDFARHNTVTHSHKEYVRYTNAVTFPDAKPYVIHTNTVEGYFSVFKRGMRGTYQWCSEKHLHRYLAEFDFRYSNREKLGINDTVRAELALKGFAGKRLTYRTTCH